MPLKPALLFLLLLAYAQLSAQEDEKDTKDKWVLLTADSQVIRSSDFDNASGFQNNIALVIRDKKIALIHRSGKMLTGFEYDHIEGPAEGYMGAAKDQKCGIIDTLGNMVLPLIYEKITPVWQGVVGIRLNGKWGFINLKNEQVTPMIFEEIQRFHEGLAAVKLEGKTGFIDKTGEFVIQPVYDSALNFHHGKAKVAVGLKYGFINKKGEAVMPLFEWNVDMDYSNPGKYEVEDYYSQKRGIADSTGKIIVPLIFDRVYSKPGYYITVIKDTLDGLDIELEGVYNTQGKELMKPRYSDVTISPPFIVGWLPMASSRTSHGAYDTTGKLVLPFEFYSIEAFGDTLYVVRSRDTGAVGKYNREGKYLGESNLTFSKTISGRCENNLYISNGEKYGLIDPSWKVLLALEWDFIMEYEDAFVMVRGGKAGMIDCAGNVIVPAEHDFIWKRDSILVVEDSSELRVTDVRGKQILPLVYDSMDYAGESVLIVYHKGTCGLLSTFGVPLTPMHFSSIDDQGYTGWVAKKTGGYFFINDRGERIKPFNMEFDSVQGCLNRERGVVWKNGKCALTNGDGDVLTDFVFEFIDPYELDDYLMVKQDGKYGYISYKGKIVIEPQYDKAYPFSYDDTARVVLKGKEFKIDREGKRVKE